MVTPTFCITISELRLEGTFTGSPDGVMKEAVSIKKINNRKIISVIDDILKAASTLCFELRFISAVPEVGQQNQWPNIPSYEQVSVPG
ncbi:conserved hypothetical protein [Marinoscillum sp. 108]|nr:conserved hypothetical protein [Marinoscillum sp. 108]